MKKVYFLLSIMSVFFLGNVFAWENCSLDFIPVCGEKQGVCVDGECAKLPWTYSNICFLEQDGAAFISEGECGKIVDKEKNNDELQITNDEGQKIENDEVEISDNIQKEINTVINSIILKLDGKSDKAKEIYILDFIKQLDLLTPKLKSQIQIKKYEIIKDQLRDLIKRKQEETKEEIKEENVEPSEDVWMKPYTFSSLGIQIIAPSDWKFKVDGQQMTFDNGQQQFIVNLLEVKSGMLKDENGTDAVVSENVEKVVENNEGGDIQELDYNGEVLGSGSDKNQIISKYIRDNLCMKVFGGKRLAAYQTVKKDKSYSNVADYELMYLCQEYVKEGSSYIAKNTYSAPLKISLLREDGIYSLIKTEKPSDGAGYVDDVKRIFSLQNQKIFLGEDAATYNKIVDDLLNQNKSWANENL